MTTPKMEYTTYENRYQSFLSISTNNMLNKRLGNSGLKVSKGEHRTKELPMFKDAYISPQSFLEQCRTAVPRGKRFDSHLFPLSSA
jgi:hypothetical protein